MSTRRNIGDRLAHHFPSRPHLPNTRPRPAFLHAEDIRIATTLDYGTEPGSRRTPWWVWAVLLLFAVTYFLSGILSTPPVATPEGEARSDTFILERAVHTFKEATGRFPTGAEGLVVLTGPAPTAPTWRGYYLGKNLLTDPWGNAYLYVPATGSSPPKVLSLGPDGISGTADDIGSPWPPRP